MPAPAKPAQFQSMIQFADWIRAGGNPLEIEGFEKWPIDGKVSVPPELFAEWRALPALRRTALFNYAAGKGPRP